MNVPFLPLLTAGLPGIGGRIKTVPEDFEVEEIPAYEPCGSGDFVYLWIEKRDMGAEYFLRQIAQRLEVPQRDIGCAGLKDRHAVTRQMISVPVSAEERLANLEGDGIRLLKVDHHTNKLRSGHLRGNRFRILARDVAEDASTLLPPIFSRIREQGLPNFYGPQRFGHDGETAEMGLALLCGDSSRSPKKPFLRKLALSAAQAVLFNHYLAQRMNDGLYRQVLSGDVMSKWPQGGLFIAEDVTREQQRFDARETVTTGPIFGRKTKPAATEAAKRERAILDEFAMTDESFRRFGKLMQGTRRHNLIYIDDLDCAFENDGLRLTFTLPTGSYATVLLDELMKTCETPL